VLLLQHGMELLLKAAAVGCMVDIHPQAGVVCVVQVIM
jgi:hypothetical protein